MLIAILTDRLIAGRRQDGGIQPLRGAWPMQSGREERKRLKTNQAKVSESQGDSHFMRPSLSSDFPLMPASRKAAADNRKSSIMKLQSPAAFTINSTAVARAK